jgi:hypothetical protein
MMPANAGLSRVSLGLCTPVNIKRAPKEIRSLLTK